MRAAAWRACSRTRPHRQSCAITPRKLPAAATRYGRSAGRAWFRNVSRSPDTCHDCTLTLRHNKVHMKRYLLVLVAPAAFLAPNLSALDNGLAKTPPMGWNSWNKFGCKVREDLVRKAADAIVKTGMKDAGYQYV